MMDRIPRRFEAIEHHTHVVGLNTGLCKLDVRWLNFVWLKTDVCLSNYIDCHEIFTGTMGQIDVE